MELTNISINGAANQELSMIFDALSWSTSRNDTFKTAIDHFFKTDLEEIKRNSQTSIIVPEEMQNLLRKTDIKLSVSETDFAAAKDRIRQALNIKANSRITSTYAVKIIMRSYYLALNSESKKRADSVKQIVERYDLDILKLRNFFRTIPDNTPGRTAVLVGVTHFLDEHPEHVQKINAAWEKDLYRLSDYFFDQKFGQRKARRPDMCHFHKPAIVEAVAGLIYLLGEQDDIPADLIVLKLKNGGN